MYVSGTHRNEHNKGLGGAYADWVQWPGLAFGFFGSSERVAQAEEAFKMYEPRTMVGHSLGSNVVDILSSRHWNDDATDVQARYYNAPFLPGRRRRSYESSYSHWLDPVSAGDRAAERSFSFNPHSYK